VEADLTDPAAAAALVQGVGGVVHTAAWVDIAVPFERQAPINLHAVRYLYEAAEAASADVFVHFSTGSLYAPKDGPLSEDDPLWPTSPYEEAKLLAEDYLRARHGRGPRKVILRPALIYGPRGKVLVSPLATLPPLLEPLDGWIPRIRGGPRTNLVHARDVARAAVHLMGLALPDGATFNVAADDVLTLGEHLAAVLQAGGRRQMRLEVPYPRAAVAALLPLLRYRAPFDALNRALGLLWSRRASREGLVPELAPRLDREAVVYLTGDTVFDTARLKATGFELRYPTFAQGWAQTVRWYERNRWLPGGRSAPREIPASAGASA
jgi:nucleoside-diphosphate-sugar epimerase